MNETPDAKIPIIVYVEDNSGDAVLLKEALHERGYEATLVVIESGDKALHYFKIKESARDIPPPHCILLDSHLPIVTGAQILTFIRKSVVFNAVPVYIFASKPEYRKIIAEAPVSRESFLIKPHGWPEFLALADLLMRSATAWTDDAARLAENGGPEVPAPPELRAEFQTSPPDPESDRKP